MNTKTQNNINQYVDLYDAIQEKTGTDEVAIAIMQEMGKDKRSKEIAAEYNKAVATEKQKKWLKDLGVEFDDSITKKEASDLIAENSGKA